MSRIVNRGFVVTLLILAIAAELALRAAASGPPGVVRLLYGTTLAMYMEIESRLRTAAPNVQVLALGDSLAMTQFQPDIFAADHGLPAGAVFNASYLAQTFRSQEVLLRDLGLDRLSHLKQVLLFVNPRRLTPEGNVDAPVFRIAISDPDGPWRALREEKSPSPILDYSRLYGLSRYLVTASWRQIGRPTSWDEVEYLMPEGGVAYDRPRPAGDYPVYLYQPIAEVSEVFAGDLKRVIELFRRRGIEVVLIPNPNHPSIDPFASPSIEARFEARMRELAQETGARWVPLQSRDFQPPSDTDFLDYGHLNRSGGIAFTHFLRERIPPIE